MKLVFAVFLGGDLAGSEVSEKNSEERLYRSLSF